jgi:hypothetical protein
MDHKEAVTAFGNYLLDNKTKTQQIFHELDLYLGKNGHRVFIKQFLCVEKHEQEKS